MKDTGAAREEESMGTMPNDPFEAAAWWHDRIPHPEFASWIEADPRHRAAYAAVAKVWNGLGRASADPRILAMRRDALAANQGARSRFLRIGSVAAVVLIAILGLLTAQHFVTPVPAEAASGKDGLLASIVDAARNATQSGQDFATAVGERSTIALADGSSVVLNTNTRIEVSFEPGLRRVRLLRGQAWFEVAKDPARPFVVQAGEQRVTALGTAFDVRLDEKQDLVQITLVEGRVLVEADAGRASLQSESTYRGTELRTGEQLSIASSTAPAIKRLPDLAKVTSWRKGQVIFDDDTLAAALAEVNRYSRMQIVLADPELAALRVSGVFDTGHSQSFIETVTGHYPIRIASQTEDRVILASRESSY